MKSMELAVHHELHKTATTQILANELFQTKAGERTYEVIKFSREAGRHKRQAEKGRKAQRPTHLPHRCPLARRAASTSKTAR